MAGQKAARQASDRHFPREIRPMQSIGKTPVNKSAFEQITEGMDANRLSGAVTWATDTRLEVSPTDGVEGSCVLLGCLAGRDATRAGRLPSGTTATGGKAGFMRGIARRLAWLAGTGTMQPNRGVVQHSEPMTVDALRGRIGVQLGAVADVDPFRLISGTIFVGDQGGVSKQAAGKPGRTSRLSGS